MPLNIMIIPFSLLVLKIKLSSNFHVIIHPNGMELLKGKIVTCWMMFILLCFIWGFQNLIGECYFNEMLFNKLITFLYCIRRLHILCYFLTVPYFLFLLEFSDVFAFTHNFSPNKDKHWSIKCVFLGYSITKKRLQMLWSHVL